MPNAINMPIGNGYIKYTRLLHYYAAGIGEIL